MIIKRKSGRTLDDIGIRWYDFNFQLEKNIYCYLCCNKIKKRKLKKLDEKLKFVSYSQWKQYICNKYENYNSDELMEFSRYINQRIRNISPDHEYWNIAATVLLTIVLTKIIDIVLSAQMDFEGISAIVAIFLLEFFVAITTLFVIFQTIKPLFDSNVDENFLKDYKEIIDEIIKSKSEKSNTATDYKVCL